VASMVLSGTSGEGSEVEALGFSVRKEMREQERE
jgi:hypothetical protein